MKKVLSLIFGTVFLTATLSSRAQTYKIDTAKVTFETKSRDCFYTTVDPKEKELKKALKKYFKKTYKITFKGVGFMTNKPFLKAEDVMCGIISSKRMNLYAHITQAPTNTQMSFFGSFGYDIFIDPKIYSKEFSQMKDIMNTFLLQYLNEYYAKEITRSSKEIKQLNNKRIRISKRMDRNDRRNSRAERKIAKLNNKKPKDTKDQIANTQKTNDLTNKQTELTNKNQKATITIQLIDEKLPKLNEHLKVLMSKQKELAKVVL